MIIILLFHLIIIHMIYCIRNINYIYTFSSYHQYINNFIFYYMIIFNKIHFNLNTLILIYICYN